MSEDTAYCEEWLPSTSAMTHEGMLTVSTMCGYPFDEDGICKNQDNHVLKEAPIYEELVTEMEIDPSKKMVDTEPPSLDIPESSYDNVVDDAKDEEDDDEDEEYCEECSELIEDCTCDEDDDEDEDDEDN